MKIKLIIILYLSLYTKISSQEIEIIDDAPISTEYKKFIEIKQEGIIIEYSKENYRLARKLTKYGILNKKYSIIIPFEYDAIISLFETKDSIAVVRKANKFFAININNEKISKSYDYMDSPNQENLLTVKLNEKFSFIDSKGKEFVNWYDNPLYFTDSHCVVSVNSKFGLIDKNNNLIIPIIYEDVKKEIRDNQISVKRGKYGIVNLQNQVIIPFEYDNICIDYYPGNNRKEYRVVIEDKIGIINRDNKFIINPIYDELYELYEGFRKAKRGNYFGLINKNGAEIIPFEYDRLYKFENKERLKVSKDELWGIIDFKNNLKLPIIYREISNFSYQVNNEYSKSNLIYKVSIDGKKNMIVDENKVTIKE